MGALAALILIPAYIQARLIYTSLILDIEPIWAMGNSVLCFLGLSMLYTVIFLGIFSGV